MGVQIFRKLLSGEAQILQGRDFSGDIWLNQIEYNLISGSNNTTSYLYNLTEQNESVFLAKSILKD